MNKTNPRGLSLVLFVLMLTVVFGCSSSKAFKSEITYTCDGGKSFVLEIYEEANIAFLTISPKRFYLHRMSSESDTKYSDGNTTLWIKGKGAFVEMDGQLEFRNCSTKSK